MKLHAFAATVVTVVLAGCGGGGSDGSGDSGFVPTSGSNPSQPTLRQGISGQTGVSGAVGSSNGGAAPAVPQTSAPANTVGQGVNWDSTASAEEVVEDTRTLAQGDRLTQGFNVTGGPLDLELIFTAQYTAYLYVMAQSEAVNFLAGRAFNYFPALSFAPGTFGYKTLSQLPVGSYAIGILNTNTGANGIRYELQKQPTVTGFRYAQNRFNTVVQTLGVGGRYVQYVTLGDTYRTVIDGANTGGSVYIIPGAQGPNFLAGAGFQYITNHPCGSGQPAPGFCELRFTPGLYAIAYVNNTSTTQSVVMYGRDFVPQ